MSRQRGSRSTCSPSFCHTNRKPMRTIYLCSLLLNHVNIELHLVFEPGWLVVQLMLSCAGAPKIRGTACTTRTGTLRADCQVDATDLQDYGSNRFIVGRTHIRDQALSQDT